MGAAEGLLERKALLLVAHDASGRRAILDRDSGLPVGLCQLRPRSGWRSCFTRRVLEVREQEDESLLCTVRRCWSIFSWYEVWDADDRLVGWNGGPLLLNRTGRRLSLREDELRTRTSRFVDGQGHALAQLAWHDEDVRLTFADEIADEPFVKMLLLAASLRW